MPTDNGAALWLFGAPHGPADPETGLPTIDVDPALAEALTAAGWRRDPANVEDSYVEGQWILDHVGPDGQPVVPLCWSIEPHGHHRGIILHRGNVCDDDALTISPSSDPDAGPLPARVVMATVNAYIRHETPRTKR